MVEGRHSMDNQSTALVVVEDENPEINENMASEARMVFETFEEEVANNLELLESGDNPIVVEGIDNYYLLCDDRPICITELPFSIGAAVVRLSQNSRPIHLLGQTRSGVGEIKLRAEMWKLWALGKNFGPRISIKTPNGWTRLYDPRPVYRKVMNEGLTLVHLLHYIEGNPTPSAVELQAYLEDEFWKHTLRPSMHKLPMFYSTIKTYLLKESEETRDEILSELFPEEFYGESIDQEIDLNRSITLFSGLDERLDGLEETLDEVRCNDLRIPHHGVERDDNSTSNPRNLIAGIRSTIDIPREINRSDDVDHKSLKDDIDNPLPRCTTRLVPSIHYVSSSGAADGALEAADRLKRRKHEDHMAKKVELAIVALPGVAIVKEYPNQDELPDHRPEMTKQARPIEKKHEDETLKEDRNFKLDDPPICIICDDGGDLLCCEGPCQRYFHAVKNMTGQESFCETLGMKFREMEETRKFYCRNCKFQKHQCFICGELGSSAASPILGHQEVFLCQGSSCRRYYHPECVARYFISTPNWKTLAERIQRGQQGFQCPRHCCRVCKIEEVNPGDLVQCRRCPKAWHLDCLQDYVFSKEIPDTEVWKHFSRRFIFCKDHKILEKLQTPIRNHIRFPES